MLVFKSAVFISAAEMRAQSKMCRPPHLMLFQQTAEYYHLEGCCTNAPRTCKAKQGQRSQPSDNSASVPLRLSCDRPQCTTDNQASTSAWTKILRTWSNPV